MVRATHARVLVRFGGTLPDGWDEAKVTALCTQADYKIDGYTAPDVISTTDNIAIEIAVDVVMRMMRQSDMYKKSAGAMAGDGFTYEDVIVLTDDIKDRIDKALKIGNNYTYGIRVTDLIGGD